MTPRRTADPEHREHNGADCVEGFAALLRTLPPHLAELLRTLPPQLPLDWACELRQCSKAYMYDRIGLKHVAAVNDGRNLRIITASLLTDMASLPAANIKPTARLQSRLAALGNASRRYVRPRKQAETITTTA
jgi:hypothetical protein